MGQESTLEVDALKLSAGGQPVVLGAGSESTPPVNESQTDAANISKSEDSNISKLESSNILTDEQKPAAPEQADPDAWVGDPRYYQSGKKIGKLKPSAKVAGLDAEKGPSLEFGKLDVSDLKKTIATNAPTPEQVQLSGKAQKKLIEAKTGAKMVMRMLDVLCGWISAGTYGKTFTPAEMKDRMDYRATLEKDWEDYLLTLDIPMHPGLVVAFGSLMYLAPAMHTEAGQKKVQSLSEKIGGKIVGWFFTRRK
jgi:hypothetical protein